MKHVHTYRGRGINEHGKAAKIDSDIHPPGEGSDSPRGFGFNETARTD
jgi:hypothetical protein